MFDEVRRVLRPDGVCFVNLGDTYSGSWGNCGARKGRQRPRTAERWERRGYDAEGGWDGLPPQSATRDARRKSLVGVPWRFALAMIDRGWILRNAIVWHKPNAMPSSVRDRFANAYEFLFFFAPGERYWFDLDAVREPFKVGPTRFNCRVRDAAAGRLDAKFGGLYTARPEELARYEEMLTRPGHAEVVRGQMRVKTAREDVFRTGAAMRQAPEPGEEHAFHFLGRNPGDVWSIASEPFPEAHFATYPTALCERVILAGCPPKVCAVCGAPWARVVEPTGHRNVRREPAHAPGNTPTKVDSTGWAPTAQATELFRPACRCGTEVGGRPGVVLDPFAGSGTTLLMAQRLGRDAVGIELKPEYLEMARRRIEGEHRQLRLPVRH